MAKYRKKPVVIEAIQWKRDNLDEVLRFSNGTGTYEPMSGGENLIVIETLESNKDVGTRHAMSINDWLIKGVNGEFYPCKPEIFEKTYELV